MVLNPGSTSDGIDLPDFDGLTIWPLVMNLTMALIGWRGTYIAIGIFISATVIPLALSMRRRPSARVMAEAEEATKIARADVGISSKLLLVLLYAASTRRCAGDASAR